MRWDSPLVLGTAATIAIHIIIVTVGDAMVVTHPPRIHEPAPHVELIDLAPPEPPPELKPPPPPVTPEPPPPQAAPPPPEAAPHPHAAPHPAPAVRATPTPTPAPEAPETPQPTHDPGGDQVVRMDDIAPSATGVGVAVGKPNTGRIGRGGAGGGTGSSAGSGADDGGKPLSIAAIKTEATPKPGFDYVDLGRDYPAEAKTLGIEGDLRVRLIVDDQGKVKSRVLLNRLGHGLDEWAMQRAAQLEFVPAKDANDLAVRSVVVWTFHMSIPK